MQYGSVCGGIVLSVWIRFRYSLSILAVFMKLYFVVAIILSIFECFSFLNFMLFTWYAVWLFMLLL